jgi:hypothetical protein
VEWAGSEGLGPEDLVLAERRAKLAEPKVAPAQFAGAVVKVAGLVILPAFVQGLAGSL